MQRHTEDTRRRLGRLVDRLKEKVYPQTRPLDSLFVCSQGVERIGYEEAQKLELRPAKLGEQFGPLWSTFWFKGRTELPDSWSDRQVDLVWIAHYCESLLWMDGKPVQALNFSFGDRTEATLVRKGKARQILEFWIELSCSTVYGEWPPEKPYKELSPYVLDRAEIALFDPAAWDIYNDFVVLQQLESDIAKFGGASEKAFGAELLFEQNRFANEHDFDDSRTWQKSSKILKQLLQHKNGTLAHQITAVGEGHLDIAWWWPVAETKRKIVRTAANQDALMQIYPQHRFVCSQAYLYEVLKDRVPELFQRVRGHVASKQWIPIGGTWVEPDCHMPAGESLVRQFLFGQRFYQAEFGQACTECWLQDSFGYSAQLPQIMKLSGMQRFVTQKLHWGHLKPEVKLFQWEGLDGTRVLAHYPPEFTFSNAMSVGSITRIGREYTEDDRSPNSLMSFGWGDGGGGPNRNMIELLNRLKDLQCVPRVVMRSPSEFFEDVERDLKNRPPLVQTGELHFSRHRGTFTSQAKTKKQMRLAERALHDAEFLAAIAMRMGVQEYPRQDLDSLWKIVLRNQHHDILTGTSIGIAHEDAVRELSAVVADLEGINGTTLAALAGVEHTLVPAGKKSGKRAPNFETNSGNGKDRGSHVPVNTIGFARREVVENVQGQLVILEAPGCGIGVTKPTSGDFGGEPLIVEALDNGKTITIENGRLKAEFAKTGLLLSLIHKGTGRNALSLAGNQLQIFDDHPNDFDAWEIELFHQETMKNCAPAHDCKISRSGQLRAEIQFSFKVGEKSSLRQTVRLDALSDRLEFHCQVDWHEEHKLLKVLFPVSVHANTATYDTQFGVIERPNHFNTPQDQSRFEVVGLKFADLSEHGFGVALLTESKFGFSVHGNEMRLSLLRAPKSPDPECDLGEHSFSYAVMPHLGRWHEAPLIAEAYKFNFPIVWSAPWQLGEKQMHLPYSFLSVEDHNLIIETVKQAEDSSELVVRLYECNGGRGKAHLRLNFPFKLARFADLLENCQSVASIVDGQIEIPYRPFEIITLLVN